MSWRYLMGIAFACFALTFTVSSVLACEGRTVLHCSSNRMNLSVCLFENHIFIDLQYRATGAGRDGDQVELSSSVPIQEAEFIPWLGFGADRGSIISLSRAEYRFDFFSSYDTRSEGEQWKAGVNVFKFKRREEQLLCDETQETDWLDPVYEAKIALGQCWDRDADAWTSSCQ